VPRRRRVCSASPEARRDKEQELAHSGNLHWSAKAVIRYR
jgi:hypothetical protein